MNTVEQALVNLLRRIDEANDLHAIFTIKDSLEMAQAKQLIATEQIATQLGPCNTSKCPKCGNSLQNGPIWLEPHVFCCASCKNYFHPYPDDICLYKCVQLPMIKAEQ